MIPPGCSRFCKSAKSIRVMGHSMIKLSQGNQQCPRIIEYNKKSLRAIAVTDTTSSLKHINNVVWQTSIADNLHVQKVDTLGQICKREKSR